MSQTSAPYSRTGPIPAPQSLHRTYIAGGIGGIMALAFWALQPILVSLLSGGAEDLYGTHQYFLTFPWNGLYEAITFSGIGVGTLVVVLATTRIVSRQTPESSTWLQTGQVLGVVAGSSWIVVAGLSLAPYTSVGFFVNEFVPNAPEQAAVYTAFSLVLTGVLLTFAVGMTGWLIAFGIAARRRGVIGWPMAVFALICAALTVSPFFTPFSPPWGVIGPLLYSFVLGIVLLAKSRRHA